MAGCCDDAASPPHMALHCWPRSDSECNRLWSLQFGDRNAGYVIYACVFPFVGPVLVRLDLTFTSSRGSNGTTKEQWYGDFMADIILELSNVTLALEIGQKGCATNVGQLTNFLLILPVLPRQAAIPRTNQDHKSM
ncbi:hypothetical protein J1614_005588 [Plenodomus biglobosus]|nr:hypothetical protein J1614_005588 [Plenodomus biglobosus]